MGLPLCLPKCCGGKILCWGCPDGVPSRLYMTISLTGPDPFGECRATFPWLGESIPLTWNETWDRWVSADCREWGLTTSPCYYSKKRLSRLMFPCKSGFAGGQSVQILMSPLVVGADECGGPDEMPAGDLFLESANPLFRPRCSPFYWVSNVADLIVVEVTE
jgi:hypothetical protein